MAGEGHTLTKEERLSGKKEISALLDRGRWGSSGNMRYCWISNGQDLNRIMVSVPKRNFKRAVKRNLLKRRIREAYRTEKEGLSARGVDILFVWSGRELAPFSEIRNNVKAILAELSAKRPGQ